MSTCDCKIRRARAMLRDAPACVRVTSICSTQHTLPTTGATSSPLSLSHSSQPATCPRSHAPKPAKHMLASYSTVNKINTRQLLFEAVLLRARGDRRKESEVLQHM